MAAPASPQNTRQCVACGRTIAWDANVCSYCGKDYRQPIPGQMMAPARPNTALPLVGGILLIVAGVIGIIEALVVMTSTTFLTGLIPVAGFDTYITGILLVLGIIGLIISLFVLLGGYFATTRTHFGMAIVGSVLGLFVLSPYFIASILALVALILLAVSHHEFE